MSDERSSQAEGESEAIAMPSRCEEFGRGRERLREFPLLDEMPAGQGAKFRSRCLKLALDLRFLFFTFSPVRISTVRAVG